MVGLQAIIGFNLLSINIIEFIIWHKNIVPKLC